MSRPTKIPYEEMSEEEKKRRDSAVQSYKRRIKREREWDAMKPGLDLYNNPDAELYIECFKREDPDFARFLDEIKNGQHEVIDQEIRELAQKFLQELQED